MSDLQNVVSCQVAGIKCDAKECDYRDDTVTVADYPEWLNKPCPKCGANLLTEADYNAVKMMLASADWLNSIGLYLGEPSGDKGATIRVELDGSGIPKFTEAEDS